MISVSIDGRLVRPEEAKVSVFDRGFLYGDSVFETVRTYGGNPFALDEHLARLERSADLVEITLPVGLDVFRREILEVLRSTDNAESYVRFMVTRGEGKLGLDPAFAEKPRRVVIATSLQAPAASVYEHGESAVTWRAQRYTDGAAPGAKIGNYLVSVLATKRAREAGAHEALIVTGEGAVVEGASSNVFWVGNGTLNTPAVEAGILPGITRAHVLKAAERMKLRCMLQSPSVQTLLDAEEVFVCSSIRELVPIVRIDGQQVGTGQPGMLTRTLHRAFRELVNEQMAAVSEP